MIEQVYSNIFKIEIPLPGNPLRFTNSYYIRGTERSLLVDNGFNCTESQSAINDAINTLGIDMSSTDLFITHFHVDHSGMTEYLAGSGARIFMSHEDGAELLSTQGASHWNKFDDFMQFSGLINAGIENHAKHEHPGRLYGTIYLKNFVPVTESDHIDIGDFSFQCVMTPGHTKGHMCLYESRHRLLLCGDTILARITPNISLWEMERDDALGQYLENLDKIARLDVDIVLPGHRHIIDNCQERICQLQSYHQQRLEEITHLIGRDALTAVDVARKMQWNLSVKKWDEFPWAQKMFSAGEAMSHLYHLYKQNRILMTKEDDGIYRFHRNY